MSVGHAGARLRRGIIKAWFLLDAIIALAPPLYWAADGRETPVLGLPGALFYFVAVSACITASLIAAYFLERTDGDEVAA